MTATVVDAIPLIARSELVEERRATQSLRDENARLREENSRLWFHRNQAMLEQQRLQSECARLRQMLRREEPGPSGAVSASVQQQLEARAKSAFGTSGPVEPPPPQALPNSGARCPSCGLRLITRRRFCGHHCCLSCVYSPCAQCGL